MRGNMYEVDDLIPLVEAAVERTPDMLNPTHDQTCLNTDWDDSSRHCIAAQVLVDLGHGDAMRNADNESPIRTTIAEAHLEDLFTSDAVEFLATVQDVFDTATHKETPWGVAWTSFQERLKHERESGLY